MTLGTTVRLSDAAYADLIRLDDFLWLQGDPLAGNLLDFALDALKILELQPAIGRPVELSLRELIISRGRSGYLAKYSYHRPSKLVRVLRIRHQRESGYIDSDI